MNAAMKLVNGEIKWRQARKGTFSTRSNKQLDPAEPEVNLHLDPRLSDKRKRKEMEGNGVCRLCGTLVPSGASPGPETPSQRDSAGFIASMRSDSIV